MPDKFLDQLAEDLIEWARKEDSLKFLLFMDEIGVNERLFYKWSDRNARLKEAHSWAIRLIGARREIGTIKGQYREKPIMHTLHQYDPDWKAADEYHATKALQSNVPDWVELRLNEITVDKKDAELV